MVKQTTRSAHRGSQWRLGRAALPTAIAAALLLTAAPAGAAWFVLRGGGQFEGEIREIGSRWVRVKTPDGHRLIERDKIDRVIVTLDDGGVAEGRFTGWSKDGYTLSSGGKTVVARSAKAAETATPITSDIAVAGETPAAPTAGASAAIAAPGVDVGGGDAKLASAAPAAGLESEGFALPGAIYMDEAGAVGAFNLGDEAGPGAEAGDADGLDDAAPAEVRAYLSNLISGPASGGFTTPAPAPAEPRAEPPLSLEDPASAFAAVGGLSADDAEPNAATGSIGDLNVTVQSPERTPNPVDAVVGGALDPAGAAEPTASDAVAAFAAIGETPGLAPFASSYRAGVSGPIGLPPEAVSAVEARSCARLAALSGPPAATLATGEPLTAEAAATRDGAPEPRTDAVSMIVASSGGVSPNVVAAVSRAFFAAEGLSSATDAAAAADGALFPLTARGVRLTRPHRVDVASFPTTEDALIAGAGGHVDVAVAPLGADAALAALPGGAERILVGFDAVAIAPHPDNAIAALSRSELRGLLTGKIFDWSMIEPSVIGVPTLYLPPEGSTSLDSLLAFAGARSARPASVRYIADPDARLAAARLDPMSLAVVSWSSLGKAAAAPVGRAGAGVRPSLDAIRSGAYPIVTPIYVMTPAWPSHPAAGAFADFLISPKGQRALFESDIAPVAACDPSTCRLSAPGLAEARARLRALALGKSIEIETLEAGDGVAVNARPVAQVAFPAGAGAAPEAVINRLAETIEALFADPVLRDALRSGRISVAVRAGMPDGAASLDRRLVASLRAESVAMALRCAGGANSRVIIDTSPISGAFASAGASAGGVEVEILME